MIQEVVDDRLKDEYNLSSVWKVAEVAMACVQRDGINRPTMYTVCNELREAIKIEDQWRSFFLTYKCPSSMRNNMDEYPNLDLYAE